MGDFDFIYGDWDVANSRLAQRHVGCRTWEQFESVSHCAPRLGGVANVEEIKAASQGWSGMALRLYDPAEALWSIWWVDSRDGRLQPPVHGRFADGQGVFEGEDEDDGRPVKVRFLWSGDRERPRWEQAFSADGGATWETNWIMDFTRRES